MMWAGIDISKYGLPERGHRIKSKWLDNDESVYWNFYEDSYEDIF